MIFDIMKLRNEGYMALITYIVIVFCLFIHISLQQVLEPLITKNMFYAHAKHKF